MLIQLLMWIGLVFMILGSILSIYKNWWCWMAYNVSAVTWFFCCWRNKQWAFCVAQIFSIGLNIFGMIKWKK